MENNVRKKVTAGIMAGVVAVSSAGGVKNADATVDNFPGVDNCNFYDAYYDYLEKVNEADLSLYDMSFVEFYRNGKIIINNCEYDIGTLYVYACENENGRKFMLLCNNNPDIDIITGENRNNYKKIDLMKWRNSYVFYDIYMKFKDNILYNTLEITPEFLNNFIESLSIFDGTMHVNAPETYYGRGRY